MYRIKKNIQKSKKIFLSNFVKTFFLTNLKNDSKISTMQNAFRKEEKIKSTQDWIRIESIQEKGILKINKNKYIKIIKVKPVNFNLKTQLEKESILNSYKIFLKSCNFDIQILIQSKKENLEGHFENIKNSNNAKIEKLKKYEEEYIKFLEDKNNQNKAASKNMYLIIRNNTIKENSNILEENIIQELNEKFFKIKEFLLKCGNNVSECSIEETINIIFSFLNTKKFLNI